MATTAVYPGSYQRVFSRVQTDTLVNVEIFMYTANVSVKNVSK